MSERIKQGQRDTETLRDAVCRQKAVAGTLTTQAEALRKAVLDLNPSGTCA